MGTIANVVRRGGIFHFRRVVPDDLRGRFGRRELLRSLGNCAPRLARIRADRLYATSEDLFAIARQDPMLSTAQLARLVQDFYNTVLEQENNGRLTSGPLTEEARENRARYWAGVADRTRKALASNRHYDGEWVAQTALRSQGTAWSTLSQEDQLRCMQAVHRAGIDLADALRARYVGDFNFEPRDKLLREVLGERDVSMSASATTPPPFAPEPQPKADTGPLLSDAYPLFLDAQVVRSWTKQTANQARSSFRLLVDVCGDRGVGTCTRADVGVFRTLIERLGPVSA